MYREYFGFRELPFSIAPDPRFFYLSEQHREAMAHLIYGLTVDGGFVLLTGDVGTGKTTVCRCLLDRLQEDVDVAFILNPKVTAAELLATLCDELGVRYPADNTSIKVFVDSINQHLLESYAKGRKTVLIIEEAQNLLPDVLEQVRLLTNLETSERKLLQVIMIGQPELRERLSKPDMEQLSQRITARCHLGPLSRDEVGAYITHRLSLAGRGSGLFPESVVGRVYRLSRGIPRLINVMCDRALLGAYVQGDERVNRRTLNKAAREALGEGGSEGRRRAGLTWATSALVFLILVLAAVYYLGGRMRPDTDAMKIPDVQESEAKTAVRSEMPFQWPAGADILRSEEYANKALFAAWNVAYETPKDGDVCKYAEAKGLRCLAGAGSFEELLGLNRPAVLRLLDDKGELIYVALERIVGRLAVIALGGEARTVDLADIEKRWSGDYVLLWRAPADLGYVSYGADKSVNTSWLERRLSSIDGRESRSGEDAGNLVERVKKFQRSEGLEPDGIAGPRTLIHLINKEGSDEPLLSAEHWRGK